MDKGPGHQKLPVVAESEVKNNLSNPFSAQIKVQGTKETLSLLIRDILCVWGGFLSK